MDFNRIPDNILLKIFRLLPPRDYIRLGGVNEKFRQISIEATSELKSIDLTIKIFEKLAVEQLGWLLEKCLEGLEKIKFRPMRPGFIGVFMDFSFPKLAQLDLSDNVVNAEKFGKLMRQNQNIEVLKCKSYVCRVIFPDDVVNEKLVQLDVQRADEDFFLSATGHCPNLTTLAIASIECKASTNTRLTTILNDFFASCSKLSKFSTEDDSINSALMRADSFWRLNLREIAVSIRYNFDESMLDKFISSFRGLEVVSFVDGKVTPEMISKMASLPKLRSLRLSYGYFQDLGQNLKLFVGSEILQHLDVPAQISSATLKGFIRHCPRLSLLWIDRVKEVETAEDAANFIRSLNEFSGTSRSCHLAIRFCKTPSKIWEWKGVKDALKEVQEKLMFDIREG